MVDATTMLNEVIAAPSTHNQRKKFFGGCNGCNTKDRRRGEREKLKID